MNRKCLFIGYFSLFDNIVKVFCSFALLMWLAKHSDVEGAKKEEPFAFISAFIAFTGIICSQKLIIGVTKNCTIKLVWWIFFQCASIVSHVGILCILPNVIDNFENFVKFKDVALLFALLYGFLQVYFLFEIIKLSATYHVNGRRSASRQQRAQTTIDEKPPSYDEAMKVFNVEFNA